MELDNHNLNEVLSIGKLLILENYTEKPSFTVSRNIPELKEVTFENRYNTKYFLSVFSVLIYIFEKITNATK